MIIPSLRIPGLVKRSPALRISGSSAELTNLVFHVLESGVNYLFEPETGFTIARVQWFVRASG